MELIRNDWKLKSIHRLVLQSNTYRQSSKVDANANLIDPDNRWLSRHSSKQLDSESPRDAILFASGHLNQKLYGPGIRPFIPVAAIRQQHTSLGEQVEAVFVRTLARLPSARERSRALEFLKSAQGDATASANASEDRLADLCHALFMSNELVCID
ncbi:MAG: DUF1553 domain-containing protein [Planctomycetota bacterium]